MHASKDRSSIIVMEPTLHDQQAFAFDFVDESMLLGNSSRPPALEIVPERFGLADACEWIAESIADGIVHPL